MRHAIILLAAAAILAGCGYRGDLERPAPIFGPAKAEYEAEKAEAEAKKKAKDEAAATPTEPTKPPQQ
jgi:predicted small lipoprotein YifL